MKNLEQKLYLLILLIKAHYLTNAVGADLDRLSSRQLASCPSFSNYVLQIDAELFNFLTHDVSDLKSIDQE